MAGVKGRSGRKKITVNSENGKAKLDMLVPEAVSVIEEAVNNGDVATAKWVLEMRLGKPRQQLEHSGEGGAIVLRVVYDDNRTAQS